MLVTFFDTDIPGRYTWFEVPVSVNGSFATRNCSNVTLSDNGRSRTCNNPASSVLYDGHIPTLTGLDGDTWASQLFTIERTSNDIEVHFFFTTAPSVMAVEVVAFTCPEWDIGAEHYRPL